MIHKRRGCVGGKRPRGISVGHLKHDNWEHDNVIAFIKCKHI